MIKTQRLGIHKNFPDIFLKIQPIKLYFLTKPYIYICINYKRQYRQLNDTTKQKISQSLRGRTKSATHTQAISNGLKKYWATVPNQPNNNENKNEEHE